METGLEMIAGASVEKMLNDPRLFLSSLFAIITIALTLVTILHTMVTHAFQRNRERVSRAVELYEEFYTVENYTRVVAPVFEIVLKWNSLSEPLRSEYRKVIRDGWIGFANTQDNMWIRALGQTAAMPPGEASPLSVADRHYLPTRNCDLVSEHESLTTFLYFWVKIDRLLQTGVVCPKTTQELFTPTFLYYAEFFQSLEMEIKQNIGPNDLEPSWFKSIERLKQTLSKD